MPRGSLLMLMEMPAWLRFWLCVKLGAVVRCRGVRLSCELAMIEVPALRKALTT